MDYAGVELYGPNNSLNKAIYNRQHLKWSWNYHTSNLSPLGQKTQDFHFASYAKSPLESLERILSSSNGMTSALIRNNTLHPKLAQRVLKFEMTLEKYYEWRLLRCIHKVCTIQVEGNKYSISTAINSLLFTHYKSIPSETMLPSIQLTIPSKFPFICSIQNILLACYETKVFASTYKQTTTKRPISSIDQNCIVVPTACPLLVIGTHAC